MRPRTALQSLLSLLIAGLIVASAIVFSANGDVLLWARGHRDHPMLWLVDFCALFTLALLLLLIGTRNRMIRMAEDLRVLKDEHRKQLEALLDRAENLEEENAHLHHQTSELEAEMTAQKEDFDDETRQLSAKTLQALQGQLDAQARQLEAVNMALQYHRAELTQLRHGLRAVQHGIEPPHITRLSPAEFAAITQEAPTALTGEVPYRLSEMETVTPALTAQEEEALLSGLTLTEAPLPSEPTVPKTENEPNRWAFLKQGNSGE